MIVQLAGEVGAAFINGGFLGSPEVRAHIKNWTNTLDIVFLERAGHGFRMMAPFVSMDGFRLVAYHDGSPLPEAGPLPVLPTGSRGLIESSASSLILTCSQECWISSV